MKKYIVLILISSSHLIAQNIEDFHGFTNKFFSDSIFQLERTRFPLLKVVFKMKNLKDDSVIVSKDQWVFTDFGFWKHNYNVQLYDNFKSKLRNTNERVVAFEGMENGINVSLYFTLFNGKWFFIKWIDAST